MKRMVILAVMALFLTGCQLSPEQMALLTSMQGDMASQSKEIQDIYAKYKSGELTVNEMRAATENLVAQYGTTKETVDKLEAQNVPWWQMALWGVAGLLGLRGMPSKGPVPLLAGLAGKLFTFRKEG